jgi:hypothetical protein
MESRHTTGVIARGYRLLSLSSYSKLKWAHRALAVGLDIVEFPLNVNGKSFSKLSVISDLQSAKSFEPNVDC